MAYTIEVYEIIYWAELGHCDGGGTGYWEGTKESIPFETRKQAQEFLENHPNVHKTNWGELRPNWPYGITRVRREAKLISTSEKND